MEINDQQIDEFVIALKLLIERGMNLEGRIEYIGNQVREKSKNTYPDGLMHARMILFGVLTHLLEAKSGQPGKTNQSISERLTRITAFMQGFPFSERLISEGQYIKAAGVLKQDLELLARMCELRKGDAKYGSTPNVKHVPEGMRRYYGDLNDVAHIAKEDLLLPLLFQLTSGEVTGVSPFPVFNENAAKALYELHVFILFEMVREAVALAMEMYGEDAEHVLSVMRFMPFAIHWMENAGFKLQEEPVS